MDYQQAIALVIGSELDNKDEIVEAIKGRYTQLVDNEKTYRTRAQQAEKFLKEFSNLVSAEGETAEEQLTSAKSKVAELTNQNLSLTRDLKLRSVAQLTNTNFTVLSAAIGNALDKVSVNGDAVTIDGKSFDDWLKLPEVAPFAPALMPKAENPTPSPSPSPAPTPSPTPTPAPLPTGGTGEGKPEAFYKPSGWYPGKKA